MNAQSVSRNSKGKVLVVLSAADSIPLKEGGVHPTGLFLGEVTEPAEAMIKAGYELVFASPNGRAPTIDADSRRGMYWKFSKKKLKHADSVYAKLVDAGINTPYRLEDFAADTSKLSDFTAIFVPGGHGPLVDLYFQDMFKSQKKTDVNTDMGKILSYFHERKLPTGLICHAPAVLAAAPKVNGQWIYAGYKITAISRASEWFNEDMPGTKVIKGHVGQYPSDILRAAGAKYVYHRIPTVPYVVEDRELMTGQDPFSAGLMGKRFVQKLNKFVASKKQ
ncbi:MAG: type 1 glutamine amidotransferase domain-containing protein [Bdellovibrionota bacterium]